MDKVSSLVPWEGDLRWSWCIGGLGVNASSPTRPEWKGRSRQREKYSVRQYFLFLFLTEGLCWCAQAFSLVTASKGYTLVAVCRLLTAVTSLVAEHGLQGSLASLIVVLWLQALQHIGSSWPRNRPPVSPPSAGRLPTTGAPRKSFDAILTEPCGKFWRQTHPSELPRIKAGGPGL